MNKLLLIDGNSLLYRAYFGTAYGPSGILKNGDGFPINAILTFTRMLWRAIEDNQPTHILIAFDAGKKTVRHDKMPEYKAGRSQTPPELIMQIDKVKHAITLMDIKQYQLAGIEADDIIGTLATRYHNEQEIIILSSDKDMYQLVKPDTSISVPQNGSKPNKIIDFASFYENFGYLPEQVPDIKGLAGDPSDNLKGVEGIGPKGAVQLIAEFGTLENIYEQIEKVPAGKKAKLLKNKTNALLCKEIAKLITTIDIPFDLEQLKFTTKISTDLIAFYDALGLKSICKMFKTKQKNLDEKKEQFFNNIVL